MAMFINKSNDCWLRHTQYRCWGIAVLITAFILVGCAQSPRSAMRPQKLTKPAVPAAQPVPVADPNQIVWSWQPKALRLAITADSALNRYEDQPHTLMLCLYQLSSATAFGELAKNPAGVNTLLKCEGFDSSVVQSERLFVQPGEQYRLVLDRLEKGRYVALVAGYAREDTKRVSPIFSFPTVHYTTGALFWKKDQYLPGELSINLVLTDQSLQSIDP